MSILADVTIQLSDDLLRVEAQIVNALSPLRYSTDLRASLGYLLKKPGKRLRPILTILAYRANMPNGPLPKSVIQLAAAIELIHMASLIHDDIIDAAELRHDQPAFHQQYGTAVAIPVGVLLYAVSLQLLSEIGELPLIKNVSRAVDQLCGGELNQVMRRDQFQISVLDYLIILKKKTSALFALASWGGAYLAGVRNPKLFKFRHFGHYLGLLYQITDDLLDVLGDSKTLQKGANQDFILGEVTLPFIFLIQEASDHDRSEVVRILTERDQHRLPWLLALFDTYQINERCQDLIKGYADKCKRCLSAVDNNQFSALLSGILLFITDRGNR